MAVFLSLSVEDAMFVYGVVSHHSRGVYYSATTVEDTHMHYSSAGVGEESQVAFKTLFQRHFYACLGLLPGVTRQFFATYFILIFLFVNHKYMFFSKKTSLWRPGYTNVIILMSYDSTQPTQKYCLGFGGQRPATPR